MKTVDEYVIRTFCLKRCVYFTRDSEISKMLVGYKSYFTVSNWQRYAATQHFWSFGINDSNTFGIKNLVPLNPVPGGVRDVALFIISHEQAKKTGSAFFILYFSFGCFRGIDFSSDFFYFMWFQMISETIWGVLLILIYRGLLVHYAFSLSDFRAESRQN